MKRKIVAALFSVCALFGCSKSHVPTPHDIAKLSLEGMSCQNSDYVSRLLLTRLAGPDGRDTAYHQMPDAKDAANKVATIFDRLPTHVSALRDIAVSVQKGDQTGATSACRRYQDAGGSCDYGYAFERMSQNDGALAGSIVYYFDNRLISNVTNFSKRAAERAKLFADANAGKPTTLNMAFDIAGDFVADGQQSRATAELPVSSVPVMDDVTLVHEATRDRPSYLKPAASALDHD